MTQPPALGDEPETPEPPPSSPSADVPPPPPPPPPPPSGGAFPVLGAVAPPSGGIPAANPPAGFSQAYGPPPQQYVPMPVASEGTDGTAVASLVLGILGIPLAIFCWVGGVPLAIAAIITGFIARNNIARSGRQGSGVAMAGLVMGFVGVGLALLFLVVVVALGTAGSVDR